MGIISNTLTTSTCGYGVVFSTGTCINEDGSINSKGVKGLLTSTVAAGASATAGGLINNYQSNKIKEKYLSSYVDSLSDEELTSMLEQLNMLEATNNEKNNNKTI